MREGTNMSAMVRSRRKPAIAVLTGMTTGLVAIAATLVLDPLDTVVRGGPGGDVDLVDPGWRQLVTANLARAEYEVSQTASGLQAPNRAQNLRTAFDEEGISVVPRTGEDVAPAWRFSWETTGLGRPGRIDTVTPSVPRAAGHRVTYRRNGWSEWYENTSKGLEQGFTIERRPLGEGPLRIEGRVCGSLKARMAEDGAVDFLDLHGARAIRYGELHVWDARGVELPAELRMPASEAPVPAAEVTLAIVIDDHEAAYPLTVDPLMTSPAWTAESNQSAALFGHSVATAGDVNGDGYSDVIVGAWTYDNGEAAEGRAFVYHGSASGLSVAANWTAEGDQAAALFGYSVATAGDVNGDGYDDVIVGAWYYDNGETNEGRAYVYHGSPSGLSLASDWVAESDQMNANFGVSVATAGDVNGDGFADVIVGASFFDNGQENEGRASVYHGSAGGLSSTPNWTAESEQVGAQFGGSVATAGDVNGDGFSDVIVGSQLYTNGQGSEGRAFVFHGSSIGLSSAPGWTAESNQANAYFGGSVAGAGDVNGDGYADVIVGAPLYTNGQSGEGRAYVYLGSGGGLSVTPNWTAESDQGDAHFGGSVATAGDVNGDGHADVIVGAKDVTNGQFTEGRAYVYLGSESSLDAHAFWTEESDQAAANLGCSVATAGDVNGDGYSDVIVGASGFDNGESDEGRALVYHGSARVLALYPQWFIEGDQGDAVFALAMATAGDVNGDGYSDVIIGTPYFDNGQVDKGRAFVYEGSATGLSVTPNWMAAGNQGYAAFGFSVASAGDVNGDGFSDVIVGSPGFGGDQPGEGRALVYHGSPGGLSPTPDWIAEGNQDGANFGVSVATAGDVNGDGYADAIVGADLYDGGEIDEGRAFVYLGSPAGLATSPSWTAECDHAGARLGYSASTTGDVNGDGHSDVIVGAPSFTEGQQEEGRAFVYHGSPTGLGIAVWMTPELNLSDSQMGFSVSTAGDVNADGFSDVIVGAPGYDDGEFYEGYAFVYHGSPTGLGDAAWTAEGGQPDAGLGTSVSAAGDVNGDGYGDVIVGAPDFDPEVTINSGIALVYLGSSDGLSPAAAWAGYFFQDGANCGYAVASAGDVDGDGFSDVIVGMPGYASDTGSAMAFLGNERGGLDRLARQARTDDSAPIALLGESDSESSFLLKALGRTAAGRGRVRLEAEVKPFGIPFDGGGLVTGVALDTGAPSPGIGSAVPLSELAGGLTEETLYHWRLRIVADSPFFPRTPWLTQAGNGLMEADLRTAAAPPSWVADDGTRGPGSFVLDPVRPNPLRSHGEIAFRLAEAGQVRLAAYDVAGREVVVLTDGTCAAGHHTVRWNGLDASGRALPDGVYFVRLQVADRVTSRKLAIAR